MPIKIVDDFKVHLPKPYKCDTVNWFKRNKFIPHNKLIHDFIIIKDFNVTDSNKMFIIVILI